MTREGWWRWPATAAGMLGLSAGAGGQGGVYGPGAPAETARVEIVALVSAAHTAYAGNQDTYVGRIYLPHDKGVEKEEGRLALLVDRYSGAGERIRRSALVEHRELEMRVRRDESCDRRAKEVTLKAKGAEVYRDDLRGILQERADDPEPIACFAVEHGATRLWR